jgi:hypothetical protein
VISEKFLLSFRAEPAEAKVGEVEKSSDAETPVQEGSKAFSNFSLIFFTNRWDPILHHSWEVGCKGFISVG